MDLQAYQKAYNKDNHAVRIANDVYLQVMKMATRDRVQIKTKLHQYLVEGLNRDGS